MTNSSSAAPPLLATVAAELARLDLPEDAVALMGFSQGAMMVLYAGLRRSPPRSAILAYSGAMLDPAPTDVTGRPPVLLVHGRQDDVVPFTLGRAAEASLKRLGVKVRSVWRDGLGHGIDEAGLSEGALFLQQSFAERA